MVYAAQPPLYTVKVGDEIHHAFSDADKERLTAELCKGTNRKPENLQWVRFKGLGEMDVEELAETCLDPEHPHPPPHHHGGRHGGAPRGRDAFETLMGSDVARRRQFLLDNSDLIDPAALDV